MSQRDLYNFAPPSITSSDGARSAVPSGGDGGGKGNTVGAVVGTMLVLIVLAFAVVALFIALRRNKSSGCSIPPPTPWVQELSQDVAANNAAIQNLEQEVDSSPDAPAAPASLTVHHKPSRAPQSMLLDRTAVAFYDGTRELQEKVRGGAVGAADNHGGFDPVGVADYVSDVQKNEHLPLGKHEMGVEEQFAPVHKSSTMEDIDGSVVPYDGNDDDAIATFDQFKDARMDPFFVTGDGMPLPTRAGMTKYRAAPASAFDFTDGAVDNALDQFIASEAHEANGELNGGKNLLWAELAGMRS